MRAPSASSSRAASRRLQRAGRRAPRPQARQPARHPRRHPQNASFGLAKIASERDVEATEPGTPSDLRLSVAEQRGRAGRRAQRHLRDRRDPVRAVLAARARSRRDVRRALSAVLRDTPPALADPAWPIIARCLEKVPASASSRPATSPGAAPGRLAGEGAEAPRDGPPGGRSSPGRLDGAGRTARRARAPGDVVVAVGVRPGVRAPHVSVRASSIVHASRPTVAAWSTRRCGTMPRR